MICDGRAVERTVHAEPRVLPEWALVTDKLLHECAIVTCIVVDEANARTALMHECANELLSLVYIWGARMCAAQCVDAPNHSQALSANAEMCRTPNKLCDPLVEHVRCSEAAASRSADEPCGLDENKIDMECVASDRPDAPESAPSYCAAALATALESSMLRTVEAESCLHSNEVDLKDMHRTVAEVLCLLQPIVSSESCAHAGGSSISGSDSDQEDHHASRSAAQPAALPRRACAMDERQTSKNVRLLRELRRNASMVARVVASLQDKCTRLRQAHASSPEREHIHNDNSDTDMEYSCHSRVNLSNATCDTLQDTPHVCADTDATNSCIDDEDTRNKGRRTDDICVDTRRRIRMDTAEGCIQDTDRLRLPAHFRSRSSQSNKIGACEHDSTLDACFVNQCRADTDGEKDEMPDDPNESSSWPLPNDECRSAECKGTAEEGEQHADAKQDLHNRVPVEEEQQQQPQEAARVYTTREGCEEIALPRTGRATSTLIHLREQLHRLELPSLDQQYTTIFTSCSDEHNSTVALTHTAHVPPDDKHTHTWPRRSNVVTSPPQTRNSVNDNAPARHLVFDCTPNPAGPRDRTVSGLDDPFTEEYALLREPHVMRVDKDLIVGAEAAIPSHSRDHLIDMDENMMNSKPVHDVANKKSVMYGTVSHTFDMDNMSDTHTWRSRIAQCVVLSSPPHQQQPHPSEQRYASCYRSGSKAASQPFQADRFIATILASDDARVQPAGSVVITSTTSTAWRERMHELRAKLLTLRQDMNL